MHYMERPAVIWTDCCPAITEYDHLSAALTHYRLDGEAHTRLHSSWVGVTTRVDVWGSVEIFSDTMTRKGRHHGQILFGNVVLDSGP